MNEFDVCRERTPEEEKAVQNAEVTRYMKVIEEEMRRVASETRTPLICWDIDANKPCGCEGAE